MADSEIFPHSYNTLIGFDVADEQMNSMNKCDVGPPYANGLFLYTQKTSVLWCFQSPPPPPPRKRENFDKPSKNIWTQNKRTKYNNLK